MRVAVTGASGFLGKCLSKALEPKVSHMKLLVHNDLDGLDQLHAEIVRGDIRDKNTLSRLLDNTDVVFHLAAILSIGEVKRDLVHEINVLGTKNVIEACQAQKVKKLVYFSSIKALEVINTETILDESASLVTHAKSAYDASKAECERMIQSAAAEGLASVVLNPTAVIGPGDAKPSYLGEALLKIYRNEFPMLISGGYNFVDVRDVVEAAITAGLKENCHGRYILPGNWHDLREIASITEFLAKKKINKMAAPLFLAQCALPFVRLYSALNGRPSLFTAESLDNIKTSHRHISSAKAMQDLAYAPRPIVHTLTDTYEWFKSNKMI
jgi:dihydroflavonol-4-reductase